MEKRKFSRCDSCQKLYPEEQMESVIIQESIFDGKAKEGNHTKELHGLICDSCGTIIKPTTKKTTRR